MVLSDTSNISVPVPMVGTKNLPQCVLMLPFMFLSVMLASFREKVTQISQCENLINN